MAAKEICPSCQRSYDRPEGHFAYSRECPECFRPNDPPQPQCNDCSSWTRWDTREAYDEFLEHMRDTARVRMLRGLVELIGGVGCLVALIVSMFTSRAPGFIALSLFVLGFITLTADGLVSLMRSRRIARFR